jgi:hypothetical protein
MFVSQLGPDHIEEPRAICIAKFQAASCTNLPIALGVRTQLLPLLASKRQSAQKLGIKKGDAEIAS